MGAISDHTSSAEEGIEQTLFDVLSNQRRRFTVYAMSDREEIELGTLAERIAAWENEQPVDAVTSAERKRVYTALQQSHLPKLADAGLIEYDDRAGVVRPQEDLEAYDVYMEVVSSKEIPWSEYYLGLAAVAAGLTAAVWVNAWPFAALPDVAWTAAITVALGVSAVAHVWSAKSTTLSTDGTPPEVDIDES